MTARLLVAGVMWAAAARDTARRHWRRLLLGATIGWALASLAGAVLVVVLEPYEPAVASTAAALVFVYAGILAGAVSAYAVRRDDGQA